MVLDIVKQAVKIKMVSKAESPLLSPAEHFYACVLALQEIGKTKEEVDALGAFATIEAMREVWTPAFEKLLPSYEEKPPVHRLLHLLVKSRVKGAVTDEIKGLL